MYPIKYYDCEAVDYNNLNAIIWDHYMLSASANYDLATLLDSKYLVNVSKEGSNYFPY